MNLAREAFQAILLASEPNPALIINRRQDILLTNRAADRLFSTFCAKPLPDHPNIARLLISEDGFRRTILNWEAVTFLVLDRIRRELANLISRTAEDEDLLREILPTISQLRSQPNPPISGEVLLPVKFRNSDKSLNLFTIIATLGTPVDITLQEIRIETFFPADKASQTNLTGLLG